MDLKDTVFLPKTPFAMRAGLATKEPDFLAYWENIDLYACLRKKSAGRKKFILHFGPPYANGHIHTGHALSEVLKDILNKTYQMMGYDAPMVPGWDCHGLPIEWKIEESYRARGQKKEDVPTLDFLSECRAFAQKWVDTQRTEFKRLGIVADWKNPYITMTAEAEAHIAGKLLDLMMKGYLYRGLKPVLWSVVEKTALAEAEVDYKDHISDAIDVAFPIVKTSRSTLENAKVVIWTTTPWTLPGNRAIAYGNDITYVLIAVKTSGDKALEGARYLVAKELLPAFCGRANIESYELLDTVLGQDLKGTVCAHPFRGKGYDFDVPLLPGDHVTTDAGTGFVHTAPGHGLEDFMLGKAYDIEVPATVDNDGTYYAHVPLFAGLHIYKANAPVIEALRASCLLVAHHKLTHSYPHSWRSKTPLIYRTTAQWFVDIDKMRDTALQAIDAVQWFPKAGRNRIHRMVENRPDWCLSRQRTWGVPICLFVHKETGEPLQDIALNTRIVDLIKNHGIEGWHTVEAQDLLGEAYNAADYEKVNDILDVWFDSACTHAFVLEERPELSWPADVYLEGSDQHRGWFQSSLMVSTALKGTAPYKNVVTHGFVLDEKGYKMSKSLGNTIVPQEIVDKLGADILRLWIVGCDYSDDVRIGNDILKHQEDIYRRLRNTLRYLLGGVDGFSPEETVEYDALPELEKWVLHQLTVLEDLHKTCVKAFDFSTFYTALHTFCSVDLSSFYFDVRKDTLYCDAPKDLKRRANRTVMHQVFMALVRWLAPVLSFTAEEAWFAYHKATVEAPPAESIHSQTFDDFPENWKNTSLAAKWDLLRNYRRVIMRALEIERAAKTIGSSLQAHVVVYTSAEQSALLQSIDLAELSITSQATVVVAQAPASAVMLDDVPDIGVVVNLAEGEKCPRCWRHLPEVGKESDTRPHATVCYRCETVVTPLLQKVA